MDRGNDFVMAIGAFHRIHIGERCIRHFVFLFLLFLCQFFIEKLAAIAAFFCLREDFFGAVGAFFVFRHDWLLDYVGLGGAAVGFVIRVVAADNQGGVIVACAGWVRRSCNPTGEGDSAGLGAVW